MTATTFDHAVVLGGGIAGLAVAAALAPHSSAVTLVDRDHFDSRPGPRAGVPQSRHVHTLLLRGAHELESVVPGLGDRLVRSGAQQLDWTEQRLRSMFGWAPRYESGLVGTFCSRDLLEHEVRHAVLALPGVRLMEGTQAVGLAGNRQRVGGVLVQSRGSAPSVGRPGTEESGAAANPHGVRALDGDLVVDATGRSSLAPQWLAALGLPPPAETVVTSNLGYASRTYRVPADFDEDWLLLVVRNPRPSTRGGVLYPIEDGRWIVTLAGIGHELPPHDEEGFAAFARDVVGGFGEILDGCEPLTRIATYRRTQNRWRHWDRLGSWPEGLIVVGDALCCFNPVYGQGMTVAAIQAGLVRRALGDGSFGLTGARGMQRRLGAVLPDPWTVATNEDFRHPGTQGHRSPSTRLAHWYSDRVLAAAVRDAAVHRRFMEVTQMLRPQRALVTPHIARRVLTP